ncbi:MAG: choice-of-anchor J domain-containing protein, partial [Acidobacteriota bacterium]
APPSFSTTIYTDPFTGYYSIQLDNGYNYTFTVNAVTPGYVGQSRPVSVTGADQSQNFVLSPVVPDCTVPGYVPPELPPPDVAQNFDGVTPPAIPGGWANYSFSGGANWYTNAGTHFPSGYPAATPPNLAYFNSWSVFSGNALLYMTSPVDFSTASSPELVFSLFHDTGYSGSDDNVQVMYSTDGNTFYSIGPIYHRYNGSTGWQQIALPLTSLAGQSTIYLAFYGTSYYGNDVHIDSIEVYENFAVPCGTIAGGLVAGFVTDSNTTDPLVGAMVANDIGGSTHTVATPSDPNINDGYYSMFTPIPTGNQPPGQRTFTASMAKYGSESQVINVIPSTVNRLDFALGAGWLELSPAALSSRLYPGQEQHQELDVINHGNMAADFKLLTLPITTTWPHLSPVVPMSHPKTPSTGRAPHAPNGAVTSRPLQIMLDGVPAFGEDVNNGIYGTWADTTDPGNWTTISGESGTFFAGCFLMGDFSKEYVLDYNTNTLQTVDTTTGAATVIGPASPGGGESWTGMTSTVDGTLYASGTTCGSSTLYTVDPGTGTVTPVGPITNAPCMIDISANAAGEIYGVDIVNDNLVKVDPATGAGTIIGPTGINANYAQGLAFDQVTGTLWWASFNLDTFQGEMRVIDTTTGASTLVGVMPGGAEIDAFAIPTSAGASLPWLVLDPTEGTVDAGATFPVDAHFIADGAPHFGIFRATIKASSDTPYPTNDVPVCFTKAFLDMPVGAFADKFVHGLAGARISTGCGGGNFCPNDAMTRGVMARWIELARHGADYAAPPCTGIFSDVPCESTPNADYIEAFYNEGITAGCYYNPDTGERRYCPNDPVLRQQMAVFIDVAKGWPGQDPCEQIFDDAPCASAYTPFINTLYLNGVTAGCGNNNFCGTEPNTRAQMSVFIDVAWEIPTCQ